MTVTAKFYGPLYPPSETERDFLGETIRSWTYVADETSYDYYDEGMATTIANERTPCQQRPYRAPSGPQPLSPFEVMFASLWFLFLLLMIVIAVDSW